MSDICQPSRSVVESQQESCVGGGDVARVRSFNVLRHGCFVPEMEHIALEPSLERASLPKTTKMMLENKGIYGWWRSDSASPSPGLVCFSVGQRANITKSERSNDFRHQSGHSYESPEKHEQICQILRAEEKLAGHRCFCAGGCSNDKDVLTHLKALDRPYCLLYALFQQACQMGGTGGEGLAYMTHLKRVATESKLGWGLFDFRSAEDDQSEVSAGPNVFANSTKTSKPSLLHHLQLAVNCIEYGINFFQQKTAATAANATACSNSSAETGAGKSIGSNNATLGSAKGGITLRSSLNYVSRMRDWASKRWDEFGRLSISMWVPAETVMTEDSRVRLQRLLTSMNRLEALLIRRNDQHSGPVITTFSDIAPVWLRHLRPSLVDQDALKALDQEKEVLPLSRCGLSKPKAGSEYVLHDLLGFSVHHGLDGLSRPQPLAMTLEAPECSVPHLLNPLKRQLQDRLQRMRDAGSGACEQQSISGSNHHTVTTEDSSMPSYKPWWKRSDDADRTAERDQLIELEQEQAVLTKCMEAHLNRLSTSSTPSIEFAGPLSYEPYPLVSDLYGRRIDGSPFSVLGEKPFREVGQSRKSLFNRPGVENPLIRKETLDSYFNANPSEVFELGNRAAVLADSGNPTESEELFQQSLFGSRG